MLPEESGVLIQEVNCAPGETSELRDGDVLLQVGTRPVDNFGNVQLLGHRVSLSAGQDLFYLDDQVDVKVRRNGQVQDIKLNMRRASYVVPRCLYGTGDMANAVEPEYFIVGGLVFAVLTVSFLEQAWPDGADRPAHLMDQYWRGAVTPTRKEIVMLLSILSGDVNAGHGSGYVGCPIVERVNGETFVDMADMYRLTSKALKEAEFLRLELTMSSGPYTIGLKTRDIPMADQRIMALYQLPALASRKLTAGVLEDEESSVTAAALPAVD